MAYSNTFSNDVRGTKVYAEVRCDAEDTSGGKGFLGFGIADAALPLDTTRTGVTNESVGFYTDGKIYRNNTVQSTIASWAVGDWLGIQVDIVAQTVAFRNITTGGSWSSTVSISTLVPPLYLVVSAAHTNDAITANFDDTFVGAVPSGFTRWDGLAATPTGALAGIEASDTAAIAGQVASEVVEPPIISIGGGYYPPLLLPIPVEGAGYGILPELEGEAHGTVFIVAGVGAAAIPHSLAGEAAGAAGAGGHSQGRLTVKAAATGARGATGAAAVVLGLGAAAGSGSVVVGGKGSGMINIEAAAGGRHDDDDAVVVWLLAA